MVARFLRNLLLAQAGLFIFTALASGYWGANHPSVAGLHGLLAVAALRFVITLENFLLAWYYRSPTPITMQLGLWQSIRLFFAEFYATLISSSWLMWRKTFAQRPHPQHPASRPPVLLVHGYGCNSGYWHAMSAVLSQHGISHYALDLEPILADIDDYVPLLAQRIEEVCAASHSSQVLILAHSMGGLVSRAYLQKHGCKRVAHVITLGSPHHGTGLANFGPGRNSRQMQVNKNGETSSWLKQLEATENDQRYRLFTSIYSHHDNIVSPQTSSELSGARNIALAGIGHVALALHPEVQACVIQEIQRLYTSQVEQGFQHQLQTA